MASPTREEVLHQLSRILDSPPLSGSARLSRFLRYVVERTCAGEGRSLKEFLIATEVFDRDERFDSRLDSLVRVEAGRLRSKLAEYYAGRGAQDAVIIRIPKGGYTPEFQHRARSAASAPVRMRMAAVGILVIAALVAAGALLDLTPERSTRSVSVVVVPSQDSPDAAALISDLSRELTRLGTLQVISHKSVHDALDSGMSFAEIGPRFHADVIVQLSTIRDGDDVTVEATLVDAGTLRKFWVDDFRGRMGELRSLHVRLAAAAQKAVARNATGSYWR